jgi:CRP-like cAMP-binding protein
MRLSVAIGSLLGLPAVIGNVPYSLSARAKKGSFVSFIKREDFSRLMLTDPSVSVGVLRVLAAEVRTARMALVER